MDVDILWSTILSELELKVSRASFKTLFSQTSLLSYHNNTFVIGCSNPLLINIIEKKYANDIKKALDSYTDKDAKIVFKPVGPSKNSEKENGPIFNLKYSVSPKKSYAAEKLHLNPDLNFDNFAVSPTNQMAYAAATAVSKNPGTSYNPLFLYGGVGVGKTHLMQAVAHHVLESNSEIKIVYCTGEEFTNEIIEAIGNKTTSQFKRKYRKPNILLIDDIQFIAGKYSIQEEFFHTFNAIQQVRGQVVLSSDRPPEEINKLEERLKSRFVGGLTIDIGQPDFELRTAILLIKTKQKRVDFPINLAKLLAANIKNTRKLEGVLIRILTESQTKNIPINEDLVKKVLGKISLETPENRKKSPKQIIDFIASYYNLKPSQLKGKKRDRKFSRPRQVLYYILRTEFNTPLEEIGELLGGRDHTTVLYGVRKISNLVSKNEEIKEDTLRIKQELLG